MPGGIALDESENRLGAAAARRRAIGPARVEVRGDFLYVGDEQLWLRGVTYGPFASGDGGGFTRADAERDFDAMAERGINAVRLYGVPPVWMLDLAAESGLRLMIGIPWEQHVAFLDDRARRRSIEQRVREAVASCAGHPAVLCYSIGNEIPASIVRWHGRRRIERFLRRLYFAAKSEDPDGLVTYVNYPSTEYLRLPFLDFVSFNVYLEDRERYEAYLYRLQHVADDRPLVMAEIGLDSRRNGVAAQADTLEWQVRSTFALGCAGMFLFAWTDEWHRGGHQIADWDFGLTTRDRAPKPALARIARVFQELPLPALAEPPRVSVVVCTYNGAATLRDCLEGLARVDYPDFEVIVVSDGSTDPSPRIAAEYDVRLIETENRGLSSARNAGLAAASGEIVAYIDDDARPHPDWLSYLAHAFVTSDYAGIGGPNLLPPGAGSIERCVAHAPGGPTHVMLDDREAEHIPGCNAAFRREALEAVGGFDPQFRVAGDDVDLCWRLQEAGHKLGFAPGALVWHHRRRTLGGYFRQQLGYGRAEALLERKWPAKYSPGGHVAWSGRLYGNGAAQHRGGRRWRIYYGGWGTGFFQSIYGPRKSLLESLPLMPEWYLGIFLLAAITAISAVWGTPLVGAPLLALASIPLLFDAALGAVRASFADVNRGRWRLRALTAWLYLVQPLARLYGRLTHGLTPWRRRGPRAPRMPRPRCVALWSERWEGSEQRVRALMDALCADGTVVFSGGDWDRWDLGVRGGSLGAARLRIAIEEHGAGSQLIRLRVWPHAMRSGMLLGVLGPALALGALATGHPEGAILLGAAALAVLGRIVYECAAAVGAALRAASSRSAFADGLEPVGRD